MKIASYNVENLFERAVALSVKDGSAGAKAIVAQGEINLLLRKAVYTDTDRSQILNLLSGLGLRDDDAAAGLSPWARTAVSSCADPGPGRSRWSLAAGRIG